MEFITKVGIKSPEWKIGACDELFFCGSCFAESIGERFRREMFRAVVNPYGVMYNPVSVLHSVERYFGENPDYRPAAAVLSLGTNHVYVDRASGEIADNCRKRPASDFDERELSVEECREALDRAADRAGCRVVITVSPVRYRKYGLAESSLSKAVLLLAAHQAAGRRPEKVEYFPSFEIMNDELRDYRFYRPDMLHPTDQAADYVFSRFAGTYFSPGAFAFMEEWKPFKEALGHRPFNPESEEYRAFMEKTREGVERMRKKYPGMGLPCFPAGPDRRES